MTSNFHIKQMRVRATEFSDERLVELLVEYSEMSTAEDEHCGVKVTILQDEILTRLKGKEPDQDVCDLCGQTTITKSSLNKGVTKMMITIARFVESKGINVFHPTSELVGQNVLSFNQRSNLSHLSNHGLLAPYKKEPGNWVITEKGLSFLNGFKVPKVAIIEKATKRTIRYEDEMTDIQKLLGEPGLWDQPGFTIQGGRVIKSV
jgi:hypothetical protein